MLVRITETYNTKYGKRTIGNPSKLVTKRTILWLLFIIPVYCKTEVVERTGF
jgi:hypothetical protein